MYRILLIFLLLPALAWGTVTDIGSGDLPYTASQAGSNYSETLTVTGTKITSATNGIYITGHDIVLNLGTDTLAFAVSDSATGSGTAGYPYDNYGIYIYASAYNIQVIGGVVMSAPSETTASYLTNIKISDAYNVNFYGTKFYMSCGYNVHNLWYEGGLYNVEFNSCTFTDKGTAYTSRCQGDGVSVFSYSAINPSVGDYIIKWYNCTWDTVYGGGIFISGNNNIPYIIRKNNMTLDCRNDFYTYYDDDICHGTTNNGAVVLLYAGPGTYIDSNYIAAGEDFDGADIGILTEYSVGTAEHPIDISYNDVFMNAGRDAHYSWMLAKCWKIRWDNKHVHTHHNNFTSYAASGGGAYSESTVVIDINSIVSENSRPDSFIIVEHNTFNAIMKDAIVGGMVSAVRFHVTAAIGDYIGCGNRIRHNTIHTTKAAFAMGGYDPDAQNVRVDSNTVYFDSTWENVDHYVLYSVSNGGAGSTGNIVLDGIYPQGAIDTSIYIGAGVNSGGIARTWDILVIDTLDNPIQDAIVEITNNYGQKRGVDTTGADGWVHITMLYWWESNGADSIGYNPMDYIVIYDNDTTEVENFTLAHDSYTDTTKVGSEGDATKTNHHCNKWRK